MSALMTSDANEMVTLPEASVRLGLNLDKLRLLARRNGELRSLLVQAGDRRVVRVGDLERVRALVASEA